MAFDLSAIRQQDTGTLEIVHPATGEGTGWLIEIAGPGHPATLRQRNSMIARARKAGAKSQERTAEQIDRESAEFLANSIISWSGLTMDGKPVPYSPEKALEILSDPGFSLIRDQINKFLLAETSFLKPSAKG